MKYLSVCSGIEAATVAWHGLGWEAAAYSEIEPFPSAVLAHHYPSVPNVGDMTKFKEWNIEPGTVDLLVGGTPCQSFSVAGLRKGLADPRGNLALTYCAILDQLKPRWFVWENVPGVLSSGGGRDFGSFLGAVAELGYGWAYRVLDAQFFGVAQRRRRVFVVGYLGSWKRAAEVLFEPESLRGDPAPSRKTGQSVAGTFKACASSGGWSNSADHAAAGYMQPVSMCLNAGGMGRLDAESETLLPVAATIDASDGRKWGSDQWVNQGKAIVQPTTHTLRGEGFDASEDGTGRGTPLVPVAFHPTQDPISSAEVCHSTGANENATAAVALPVGVFQDSEFGVKQYDSAGTLRAGRIPDHQMVMQPIALQDITSREKAQNGRGWNDDGTAYTVDTAATQGVLAPTLTASNDPSRSPQSSEITAQVAAVVQATAAVAFDAYNQTINGDINQPLRASTAPGNVEAVGGVLQSMQVRRLTPVECERLQGFPDNYTAIPWRGKAETPDGPRYKALGNSMAVPVMAWIGKRIQESEAGNAS